MSSQQVTLSSYLDDHTPEELKTLFESVGREAVKQYMFDISCCGICEDPRGTKLWPSGVSNYAHSVCISGMNRIEYGLNSFINNVFQRNEHRMAAHKAAIIAVKEEIMKEKEAESPGSSDALNERVTIFSYLNSGEPDALRDIFEREGIEAVKKYAKGVFNKLYPSAERIAAGSRGSVQINHRGFGFILPSESDAEKVKENLISLDCTCAICETPDKHFPWGRDSSHIPWSEKIAKYIYWSGSSSFVHSSCHSLFAVVERDLVREIKILFPIEKHRENAHIRAIDAIRNAAINPSGNEFSREAHKNKYTLFAYMKDFDPSKLPLRDFYKTVGISAVHDYARSITAEEYHQLDSARISKDGVPLQVL